jgi:hypothetical protein
LCRMLLDTGAPPQYTPDEWLRVLEILVLCPGGFKG